MLEDLRVEVYGDRAPLLGLATLGARSSDLLVASVYDPSVCGPPPPPLPPLPQYIWQASGHRGM